MRTRPSFPILLLLLLCLVVQGVASWNRYQLDEWTHGVNPAAWVFLWVWLHDLSLAALTAAVVLAALALRRD